MNSLKLSLLAALALFAAACNRDPMVARQKYLDSGNRYFNNGKFKEATIMYKRALQQDLRFGEAYYRLGLSELKNGRLGEALQALRRAVELQPDNLDAPAKLAEIYLAAYTSRPERPEQFLKEVEEMTKKILDKDPKNFDGLRLRGYQLLLRKDFEAALADFQTANQLKPNQPDLIMVYAQTLIQAKKQDEAEKLVRDSIGKNKGYAGFYDLLYASYMSSQRLAEAEAILLEKTTANPNNAGFILQMAGHYFVQNKRPESEKQLQRILGNTKQFPNAHMLVGDFYYRIREFDKATAEFNKGIEQSPKDKADYQKRVVQVLLAQGKATEANNLVAEILKDNPKDDAAIAIRASLALRAGSPQQTQAAINDLQSLVSKSPENAVLRFEYARALLIKGDIDQARVQLLEAIKVRPDFLLPKLALAQVYIQKGDFSKASETANDILQYDPENVPAKLMRSSAMIGMQQYVQARQELNAILDKNPTLTDAQFQLGMINFNEGKVKDAEAVFRKLYQVAPQDPRGLRGMVETLVRQKSFAEANALLTAELQKSPDRADLRAALANTAYQAGQFDVAITEYQKILEKSPKDVAIMLRLAEVHRVKGDMESAIKVTSQASTVEPNNPVPSLTLAMLYDARGEAGRSRGYYEKVLAAEPDNPMALNNLAYILAEEGKDLDQALTMVQKAKQRLPNNPEVSDTLGWIYIKKNLSDSAVGIFQDLVKKYPERSTFYYHLAMAHFQKGDRPQAKKLLQTALTKKPSKPEETKIKELIAKCG